MESQVTEYESVAKGILKHHGRPQKLDRKDVVLHDGPVVHVGRCLEQAGAQGCGWIVGQEAE